MQDQRVTRLTLDRAKVALAVLKGFYSHSDDLPGYGLREELAGILADIRHLCEVRNVAYHKVSAEGFDIYRRESSVNAP